MREPNESQTIENKVNKQCLLISRFRAHNGVCVCVCGYQTKYEISKKETCAKYEHNSCKTNKNPLHLVLEILLDLGHRCSGPQSICVCNFQLETKFHRKSELDHAFVWKPGKEHNLNFFFFLNSQTKLKLAVVEF